MRTRPHSPQSLGTLYRRRERSAFLWRAASMLFLVVAGLAGCTSIVVTNIYEQVRGAEYGQPAEATAALWVAGAALLLALLGFARGNSRE